MTFVKIRMEPKDSQGKREHEYTPDSNQPSRVESIHSGFVSEELETVERCNDYSSCLFRNHA